MKVHDLGIHYREGTSDEWVIDEVFKDQVYAIDLPEPPKIIVDIGANIGVSAIYFAKKYPDAKIYAFEPQSENYHLMLLNVIHYPNIIPSRYAIYDERGTFKLFAAAESHKHGYSLLGRDSPHEPVECIPLPDWMAENKIDRIGLLKIDCEGVENKIFQSLGPALDKIHAVVGEIHGADNWPLVDLLNRSGFEVSAPPTENTFSAKRRLPPG